MVKVKAYYQNGSEVIYTYEGITEYKDKPETALERAKRQMSCKSIVKYEILN